MGISLWVSEHSLSHGVELMLFDCWAILCDVGPTNKHCFYVYYLLDGQLVRLTTQGGPDTVTGRLIRC